MARICEIANDLRSSYQPQLSTRQPTKVAMRSGRAPNPLSLGGSVNDALDRYPARQPPEGRAVLSHLGPE